MKLRLRTLLPCALFFCLCYLIFEITDPSVTMTLFRPDNFLRYADVTLLPGADILDFLLNNPNPNLVFHNLVGNIVLFMPIGFLAPLFWPYWQKFYRTVAFGAGLSLVIELCQLFNFRATVTDDLLLNTLGTAFGYLWFALLACLTKRVREGNAGQWTPLCIAAAALLVYNLTDIAQYVYYVL